MQLLGESDDDDPSTIDIDNEAEQMFVIPGEQHTGNEEPERTLSVSNRSSDAEDSGQSGSEDDQSRQPSTNMIPPTGGQEGDASVTLKKSREDDIRKGRAVKAQLVRCNIWYLYVLTCVLQQLWDTLLDTRIRLQKSMVAANRFPVVSPIALRMISNHFYPALCRRQLFTIVRLSKRGCGISQGGLPAYQIVGRAARREQIIDSSDLLFLIRHTTDFAN
jgi:hypothetical protein